MATQRLKYLRVVMEKRVVTLTLNRPDKRNAFNDEMLDEIKAVLEDIAIDDKVGALVLTGEGSVFCVGGDMRGGLALLDGPMQGEALRQALLRMQAVVRCLYNLPIPTIAMVNGPAFAGGFDFALACDMRIGSPKSKFMVGFSKVGVLPPIGALWLLPRIVGPPKAAEWILASTLIEAQEAERTGILNKLVPVEELRSETMTLAHVIADGPPIALKLDKALLNRYMEMTFDAALEAVAMAQPICFGSQDRKEGYAAFEVHRKAIFKGK